MKTGMVSFVLMLSLYQLANVLLAAPEKAAQCADTPRPFDKAIGARAVLGALVIQVDPESPARRAGLAVGDFLETCNGKGLRDFGTLDAFVQNLRESAMLSRALVTVWKYDSVSESYSPQSLDLKLPTRVGAQFGVALSAQAIVVEVTAGGVAAAGGLKPGDFIEQVNGEHFPNFHSTTDVDQRVSEIISRHGELKLVVGRWKPTPDSTEHTTAFVPRATLTLSPL